MVCNHVPVAVQSARLLAQTARVQVSHLWPPNQALPADEVDRLVGARRRLEVAALRLATGLCAVSEDAEAAWPWSGAELSPACW